MLSLVSPNMNKNSSKKKCKSTNDPPPPNHLNEDQVILKKINGLVVNGEVENKEIVQNHNEKKRKKKKSKAQKESQKVDTPKEEKLDSNENISRLETEVNKIESPPSCSSTSEAKSEAAATSESSSIKCEQTIVEELSENLTKVTLSEPELETVEIPPKPPAPNIEYVQYESELQMPMIMKIIQKDLSEPYSIYTYRYFIHNWPKLCYLAMCEDNCVGAIVCKLDVHRKVIKRGYIAMLAVDQNYRKLGIGSTLVRMAIQEMIAGDADEVVLETEVTNKPALQLYEALGFVRDKRLFRYYLNGVDALRLKLWLR